MYSIKVRCTQEIPLLYSHIDGSRVAYARFVAGWERAAWYLFEWDGKDFFFGFKDRKGEPRKWGLYSLFELARRRGPLGAAVIQDHAFQPTQLSKLNLCQTSNGAYRTKHCRRSRSA